MLLHDLSLAPVLNLHNNEDSIESVLGQDYCNNCPWCQTEILKIEQNISINIVDRAYLNISESYYKFRYRKS